MRALLALVLAAGLAPAAAGDKFQVVSAPRPSSLQRQLAEVVAGGYRILDAAGGVGLDGKRQMVVLLERPEGRVEPVKYSVTTTSGDFRQETGGEQINGLASRGYRLANDQILVHRVDDFWLPDDSYDNQIVLIMEKHAASRGYAYETVIFTGFDSLDDKVHPLYLDGFRVVGLINSARRLRLVLERPLGGDAVPALDPGQRPFRLLIGAKNLGNKQKLNRAAAEGYRILHATDQSIKAPPMLLVEKVAEPDPEFEYDFLQWPADKIHRATLEHKLNKKADKGYRVVPAGVTPTRVALERTQRQRKWQYLTLSSQEAPGLERGMAQAAAAGYRHVTMFVTVGEIVVVLERPYR